MNLPKPIKVMVLSIVLFSICSIGLGQAINKTKEGTLDLRGVDFSQNRAPVSLDGDWAFYKSQLLSPTDFNQLDQEPMYIPVPKVWNNLEYKNKKLSGAGYGTYRLSVLLPNNIPPLSLEIPNVYTSYKLYINGELVSQNGETGNSRDSSSPEWKYTTSSLEIRDARSLDVVVQVSNFFHDRGGIHKSFYLGEQNVMSQKRETTVLANGLLVGGVLILGAFFLSFYLIRKKDNAVLYFGLFCFIWAIRSVFVNIYLVNTMFPSMSWTTSIRIEYISLYMSLLFGMLFVNKAFSGGFKRIFVHLFVVINFIFVFLTLILSPYHFTKLLPFYQMFIVFNFLLIFIILTRAVIRKQKEVWYSIAGILLGLSLFIVELTSYYFELNISIVLLNLGYMAVFFLNSLVLAHRFVDAFKEVSKLKEERGYHLLRV